MNTVLLALHSIIAIAVTPLYSMEKQPQPIDQQKLYKTIEKLNHELKQLISATEETERVIKLTPEQSLKIDLIKKTNEERIRSCYQVLSSLFLIYHEINQSEVAYKAMEEALELILVNNIQISKVIAHEWNDEPKFKNTLAIIRKIRTEIDEKAVIAKKKKDSELTHESLSIAQEEIPQDTPNLLTWEQAMVELSKHAAPKKNAETDQASKPSLTQKILEKILKKP